ncbi:MAG: hypothetical protein OXE78_04025 [Gammaproteobacteria bacterium]|nr:hypothetical protein [Gammaproteobacteria bacterium]MCY4359025.1 hypothetical protein [Gammaproteobacteria bacterium]
MSTVAERLSTVSFGEAQKHQNLTMIPLLAEGPAQPDYRLLDEAISSGSARVTEVSDSGSVPELKFTNDGDQPVLLLDGEELIGAKQNRILNLTVLAPANESIVIPVSCVEAGRWHSESREFSSAKRAHFARGRANKATQINAAMRTTGERRSHQGEVWREIREKSERLEAPSLTEAADAMYQTHRVNLDEYKRAFRAVDGQAGALFAINGETLGFDMFDSPATLARMFPMLVESFALDAIDSPMEERETPDPEPENFLKQTASVGVEQFPAVGEGEDLRLEGNGLSGGALVARDRVIHLCVFRIPTGDEGRETNARMLRASLRRRNHA